MPTGKIGCRNNFLLKNPVFGKNRFLLANDIEFNKTYIDMISEQRFLIQGNNYWIMMQAINGAKSHWKSHSRDTDGSTSLVLAGCFQ